VSAATSSTLFSKILAATPNRRANKCTVQEALTDHGWVSDIRGALIVGVIIDYLHLWNILTEVELQSGVGDSHFWRFATNGKCSAKLAYDRVWKTWALAKCKFILWLVPQNKCWTIDRLARRGLDHPEKCLLCD
jgi:hypothetical protein